MAITLGVQCATIRKEIGWEGKSEEIMDFQGGTIGDFLKQIQTADGRTFYERFTDGDNGVISNAIVWYNLRLFVKKDNLDFQINHGDKIVLLRSIPGGG
jgi:sulfur carrier protein ThiS